MFTTLFGKLMVWSSGWSLPLLEKYEQNGGGLEWMCAEVLDLCRWVGSSAPWRGTSRFQYTHTHTCTLVHSYLHWDWLHVHVYNVTVLLCFFLLCLVWRSLTFNEGVLICVSGLIHGILLWATATCARFIMAYWCLLPNFLGFCRRAVGSALGPLSAGLICSPGSLSRA